MCQFEKSRIEPNPKPKPKSKRNQPNESSQTNRSKPKADRRTKTQKVKGTGRKQTPEQEEKNTVQKWCVCVAVNRCRKQVKPTHANLIFSFALDLALPISLLLTSPTYSPTSDPLGTSSATFSPHPMPCSRKGATLNNEQLWIGLETWGVLKVLTGGSPVLIVDKIISTRPEPIIRVVQGTAIVPSPKSGEVPPLISRFSFKEGECWCWNPR